MNPDNSHWSLILEPLTRFIIYDRSIYSSNKQIAAACGIYFTLVSMVSTLEELTNCALFEGAPPFAPSSGPLFGAAPSTPFFWPLSSFCPASFYVFKNGSTMDYLWTNFLESSKSSSRIWFENEPKKDRISK